MTLAYTRDRGDATSSDMPSSGAPNLGTGRRSAPRQLLVVTAMFEATMMAGAYLAYSAVRGLVSGSEAPAISHGRAVLRLEQTLGVAFEQPAQSAALHAPWLVKGLNFFYLYMHLPFIAVTAVYLFARNRSMYTLARRTFLVSGAIGLAIFALFPVAPPRLLPEIGVADTIRMFYPEAYGYPSKSFVNQFAAVPSFHFGWSALAVWFIWRTTDWRPAHIALALVPPLMLATIVITGNHYWLDAAAGLLVVCVAYQVASWRQGALFEVVTVRRRRPWSRHGPDS